MTTYIFVHGELLEQYRGPNATKPVHAGDTIYSQDNVKLTVTQVENTGHDVIIDATPIQNG